jgi:DNA-binding XRE family transcriptional regulator
MQSHAKSTTDHLAVTPPPAVNRLPLTVTVTDHDVNTATHYNLQKTCDLCRSLHRIHPMMAAPRRFVLLKRLRLRAGYTRLKLAQKVGWSVSQISRVEAGLCSPSPELFAALATELKVDVDDLIAQAPKPPGQSRPKVVTASEAAS